MTSLFTKSSALFALVFCLVLPTTAYAQTLKTQTLANEQTTQIQPTQRVATPTTCPEPTQIPTAESQTTPDTLAHSRYVVVPLDEDFWQQMQQTSPELYADYRTNRRLFTAGNVLLPISILTALAAGVPIALYGDNWIKPGTSNIGYGLIGAGAALFATSIPLICVGKKRSNAILDSYYTSLHPSPSTLK